MACHALALLAVSCLAASRNAQNAPRTECLHKCPRAISRSVRKQLEKEVLKPAGKAGADNWPKGCPLDPARDLWGAHEKQKSRKRGSGSMWTCGFCGKVFKSEHYLDLHMERKHMNETPTSGVCLADYCEAFDACQSDAKYRRRREKEEETACDNETMANSRRNCEQAMSRCFPLERDEPRKLHAQLTRQFCRVLDCRIQAEKRKEVHGELMPVVIWLILITLVCFIVFSGVVCLVDYSDDIFQVLQNSGIASSATIKRLVTAREKVRQTGGCDRTKVI